MKTRTLSAICLFAPLLLQSVACALPGATARPVASRTSIRTVGTPTQAEPSLTPSRLPSTPTAAPTEEVRDLAPFRYVDTVSDLIADPYGLVKLYAPADGSVWIIPHDPYGDDKFVARWEAGEGRLVLPFDEEMRITVDDAGRAWVMRQGETEIEVWEQGAWTTQGIDQGWTAASGPTDTWWAPEVRQVIEDASGRRWVATQSDVRYFDGKRWTAYVSEDMGFSEPEWEEISVHYRIAVPPGSDRLWVGECQYCPLGPAGGGGVRWFEGGIWRGADSPIGDKCVSILTVDRSGDLWIGVKDAIWRYQPANGKWTSYPLLEASLFGYNFNHPLDLLVDQDGDVWVIVQFCGGANCDTQSYLYRIHAGEGSVAAEPSDWWEPRKDLLSGSDGRNWLLWEGVFYQIVDGDLLPVVTIEPRGITMDPFGNVWVLEGNKEAAALWVLDTTLEE